LALDFIFGDWAVQGVVAVGFDLVTAGAVAVGLVVAVGFGLAVDFVAIGVVFVNWLRPGADPPIWQAMAAATPASHPFMHETRLASTVSISK
jgi:hypothetical protein